MTSFGHKHGQVKRGRKDLIQRATDQSIREAVAELLHGPKYTEDNVRGVAVFEEGTWFAYPDSGSWIMTSRGISVTHSSRGE